jgi:concanavalin A-like lectin/glucanase superfamily protein
MARRILPALLSTVVVLALAPAAALAEGQVTLDPAAGAPGTSVVLRGSGFGAARPVTVGVSGAATRSVTSSRAGAFLAHLTIPGRLRGSIAVVSRRGRMRVVNTFFAAPGAGTSSAVEVASSRGGRVRATPARLVPGGTLRLSGSGFGRGRRLTLSVFGARHRLTTRRDGTFVMTVRAPATLRPGVMSAVLTGAGDRLRLHLVTSAPTGAAPPAATPTRPAPATTPAPAQPSASAPKPGPANTALPRITGTAREGQTLSATPGTWSGRQPITFAYRWERCNPVCFALAGTTSTHKLVNADAGFTVHVLVTATNADGSTTATSNDSAVVTPLVSPTGQVALWHMNETSGTVMADSARNHNGTLTGGVAPGQPGFAGTAFGFAGKSFVSVPSAGDLNPGDFAIRITIHVKATLVPQPPTEDWDLIRKGVFTTAGGEFKMEYQPNGQASCGFNGSLAYNEIVGQGPVINDGQWHTVQCAKTSTGIELNVDGVAFTKPGAVGAIANNEPVIIGSHGGTAEFFQGTLDEADIVIG